jgi:hypothetical protein
MKKIIDLAKRLTLREINPETFEETVEGFAPNLTIYDRTRDGFVIKNQRQVGDILLETTYNYNDEGKLTFREEYVYNSNDPYHAGKRQPRNERIYIYDPPGRFRGRLLD